MVTCRSGKNEAGCRSACCWCASASPLSRAKHKTTAGMGIEKPWTNFKRLMSFLRVYIFQKRMNNTTCWVNLRHVTPSPHSSSQELAAPLLRLPERLQFPEAAQAFSLHSIPFVIVSLFDVPLPTIVYLLPTSPSCLTLILMSALSSLSMYSCPRALGVKNP